MGKLRELLNHGLINYKDTEIAKCRHQTKIFCKGFFGRCLSEFIDWRCSQKCWYFQPSFVNCCPSNLLSGSTPVSKYSIYRHSVRVLLETIFSRSLALCIWPVSEPTKLLDHQIKIRRGGGHRQINTCRKVPLQVNFLDDNILLRCLYRSLVHGLNFTYSLG